MQTVSEGLQPSESENPGALAGAAGAEEITFQSSLLNESSADGNSSASVDEMLRVSRGFVDAKYLRAVRRMAEPEFQRFIRAVEMEDAEDAWASAALNEFLMDGESF